MLRHLCFGQVDSVREFFHRKRSFHFPNQCGMTVPPKRKGNRAGNRKRTLSHSYGTKALNCFCGTTQIDVIKRPLFSYTENICSLDNGWRFRQALLSQKAFRPALLSPFTKIPFCRNPTRCGSLQEGDSLLLFSVNGFYLVYAYYSRHFSICQGVFQNFFAAFKISFSAWEDARYRMYSRASSSVRRICSSKTSENVSLSTPT